ncbi:hypothetical protein GFL09_04245 [Pseudomonas stutzeri]|uniref:YadA-like family protein n=1 Tax=Stutzerimonas stutzeri TaxID=316 RepID=UPI00190A03BB|nr:YadA-like family protein [Stutzerimonas stutzeri]MBK3866903.1 hypothetical protein [Stutzerimonas stutzeri]
MQKHVCTDNLECTQHLAIGRKSLLACAMLAMLAGGGASAEVMTDVGGTALDNQDVTTIYIDDAVGGVPGLGNSVSVDGSSATVSVTDGVTGENTTIGASQSDFSGNVNVNSGQLSVTNGGSLTVSGDTSVTTLTASDITADTVTASIDASGDVISNVADGQADTDAVNIRQLNAMQSGSSAALNEFSNRVDARFNALDERIDEIAERAYGGVASVAALAAIPAPAPGKRFTVGAGLGSYSSESAVAIGFRAAVTESTSVTAGVSRNTASKTAASVGVGYSW